MCFYLSIQVYGLPYNAQCLQNKSVALCLSLGDVSVVKQYNFYTFGKKVEGVLVTFSKFLGIPGMNCNVGMLLKCSID